MTAGMLLLQLGLAITAFLVILNGHLRGTLKAKIDAGLSIVWLIILVVIFVVYGWTVGLVSVVLSFIYAYLTRPFASAVARKLLGYRTSLASSEPVESIEEMFQRGDEIDWRLTDIARRKEIAVLLQKHGKTTADLKENFWFLMRAGAGGIAWELIAMPADLNELLELREQGLPAEEIVVRLIR